MQISYHRRQLKYKKLSVEVSQKGKNTAIEALVDFTQAQCFLHESYPCKISLHPTKLQKAEGIIFFLAIIKIITSHLVRE